MKKMNSIRVGVPIWDNSEKLREFLDILKKYPCGIERISLFVNDAHTPMKLEAMEKRAKRAELAIERFTAEGYKAGINILSTVGHHPDYAESTFYGDYCQMTNVYGEDIKAVYCMNDDRYLHDYVEPLYRLIAATGAEHIWIDDDIRFGHGGIGKGCFCRCCMETFNSQLGTDYTRAELGKILDSGDIEMRKRWLKFSAQRISKILRTCGRAARSVNPNVKMGLMIGEQFDAGYDTAGWADALSDGGKYEIMWRPGCGAYSDRNFDDIIQKREQIGRINVGLPDCVTEIYSELENCTNQLTEKTPVSTALEVGIMQAAGCTGAALNLIPVHLADLEMYLRAIDRLVPFYSLMQEKIGHRQPDGICAGWRWDDSAGTTDVSMESDRDWAHWFGSGDRYASEARSLFEFGLPQCFDPKKACVRIMRKTALAAWSDEEVRELLHGNVMLDAIAVGDLTSRGMAELIGVDRGRSYPADLSTEIFARHRCNAGMEGQQHGLGFMNCAETIELLPVSERTEIVSSMYCAANGGEHVPCAVTMFENEFGGRVLASGFSPFTFIGSRYKSTQLKRLLLELSGYTLPSYVDSLCRVHNHSFVDGERTVVVLINTCNEPFEAVDLAVKTEKGEASVWHQDCVCRRVKTEKGEHGYRTVTVDRLPPFEMVLIEV